VTATTADTTGAPLPAAAGAARRVPGALALRRLMRQRSAIFGLVILAVLFTVAILADVLAPFPPNQVLIGQEAGAPPRTPPCIHFLGCPADQPEHFFGLDGNVRDLYSRVLHGARVSLSVGFVTVTWSIAVGMLIGAVAGFVGGWVDNVLMRVMDMLLAFPALLLAIVVVTVLGYGLTNAMLAVGVVSIPVYARVLRSSVLSVREMDYVTAARALGDSPLNILRRRVLPNSITPLVVQATLGIGTAVLEVAALSFIGLGATEPTAEWGSMIGREYSRIFTSPHLILFPGFALTFTVLGFNLLGDGLRDALDPRLNR
jgi:peptide/nickel transport system permease protein